MNTTLNKFQVITKSVTTDESGIASTGEVYSKYIVIACVCGSYAVSGIGTNGGIWRVTIPSAKSQTIEISYLRYTR